MSLDQILVLLDSESAGRHQVLEAHIADLDRRMEEMRTLPRDDRARATLPGPRHRHLPAVQGDRRGPGDWAARNVPDHPLWTARLDRRWVGKATSGGQVNISGDLVQLTLPFISACHQAAHGRLAHARRGARTHAREQSTSPCRRGVVRRPRRLVLVGRRHPQLHRRRHVVPALDARLPQPARGAARLRAQLPRLLGRDRRRRHQQPARRAQRRDVVRDDLGRRQRRRLRRRAHRVRAARLGQRLRRRHRRRAVRSSTTPCPAASTGSTGRSAGSRRRRRSSWSATRGSSWARTATPSPGSRRRRSRGSTPTADLLNSLLASVASAHGFGFANPTSAFIGHAVCDNPEWINGLSNPISESYHPNQAGHASGYAPVVGGVLGFAFAATAGGPAGGSGPGRRAGRAAAAVRRASTARSSPTCSRRPTSTARASGGPRGRTGSTWSTGSQRTPDASTMPSRRY